MRVFAEMLRSCRTWRGLTQQELADFATVSVRAIRDLESGRARHPRQNTLVLLGDVLRLNDSDRSAFRTAARGLPRGGAQLNFENVAPPAPLCALVGREAELTAMTELLTRSGHRLLTVIGLAGVGKTHLTLDLARTLHADHDWPVLWVPQARTGSAGATDYPVGRPSATASLLPEVLAGRQMAIEELAESIGEPAALLVLDDPEITHSTRAALLDLLYRCPGLRIVITGRSPRGLARARVVPLGGLGLPAEDGSGVAKVASVRLLASHVRRFCPTFDLNSDTVPWIVGICRGLDGIPWALENAAAWLLVSSPAELLALASNDPFALCGLPSAGSASAQFKDTLRNSLRALPSQELDWLGKLAERPQDWSMSEAAATLGEPVIEVARSVHTLLTHGLVRVAAETSRDRFAVLNLVRSVATEQSMSSSGSRGGAGA